MPLFGVSQDKGKETNKESQKNDTANVYKRLKRWSYKHNFTEFVYDCFFTEPSVTIAPPSVKDKSLSNKQKKTDPNARFVGKTIRNIEIVVYDPFGNSVQDTMPRSIKGIQKLGNRAHITTRKFVIRNILLFRSTDKVDLLKITESERILRQAVYINDARIYLYPSVEDPNLVDVKVVVQDRWSWDAWVEMSSTTDVDATFRDINLAGVGHQFQQSVAQNFDNNNTDFESRYVISNIRHTYVTSAAFYGQRANLQELGGSLNRGFFSPLTKWAGGISGVRTWNVTNYNGKDSVLQQLPLEYLTTDYWIGRSFNPSKKNTIQNRSRNITVAVRYANTNYVDRPSFEIDTLQVNLNTNLYITGVSYSVRKFYKDKYIYRFGATEDVPEGFLAQLCYGIQEKESFKYRHYIGFDVSRGKHFERFGYLSGTFEYGNFFNKDVRNNVTINAGILYFTNLLKVGSWSFRQFSNYNIVYGINKSAIEVIALNPIEMHGFPGTDVRGTRKMILTTQTVMYTPYEIIGFRFAPVVMAGFGMMDTEKRTFFHTQIYQSYAVGVLFRNEHLLVNSFRITVGAFPYTVGDVKHYLLNPIISFSLRLPGFAPGAPRTIGYY